MHQLTNQMGEMRVDVTQTHQILLAMQQEQAQQWAAWRVYHGIDPPQP